MAGCIFNIIWRVVHNQYVLYHMASCISPLILMGGFKKYIVIRLVAFLLGRAMVLIRGLFL
jgi:hypothetical protein